MISYDIILYFSMLYYILSSIAYYVISSDIMLYYIVLCEEFILYH